MVTFIEQLSFLVASQIGQENINIFASLLNITLDKAVIILAIGVVIILVWSLVWKGLALWKSAIKRHKIWFIIMLIVNTAGILEILYIFIFSKLGEKKKESFKVVKKK